MKPYYEEAGITIYHGNHRDNGGFVDHRYHLITDPPYGISYESHHNSSRKGEWAAWTKTENFAGIQGDDKAFDPSSVDYSGFKRAAIFGGNYCADKLTAERCWVVWDKRDGIGPNDFADCELIWTNFPKPSRLFRHVWSGLIRAGRENVALEDKVHPHQKPVALMKFLMVYGDASHVYDPFMGSGSTLIAAKELGLPAIGIELEERYCEIAANRLRQSVFNFEMVEVA